MTAEDWGYSPTPHTPPMVLDLTEGWPTSGPHAWLRGVPVGHPPRHAAPRRAMGGKQARTLNAVGLGCTAEPRRAAQ